MAFAYRADHIGSLLRPSELLKARDEVASGRLPREQLQALEDEAILAALKMQQRAGMDAVTDGELRRAAWMSDLTEAVDGFVPDHISLEWRGGAGDEARPSRSPVVGAKLRQKRRITAHESGFLLRHARGPVKMTIPSPMLYGQVAYKPGLTDQFYPSRADLMLAVAGIIRLEIAALIEEGVRYIQLDAPTYTYLADPRLRERPEHSGGDPEAQLDASIAADNAALRGLHRPEVTLAIHLCRGNSRSQWLAEGSYDPIAEKLFSQLDVDAFLLEYDSDRAGGFEPLRFVPPGKAVVLGLVSSKLPQLESKDLLKRRIEEAAQYVPLEYLALSPQCGFASTAEGNLLTMDDQQRKLERVAEVAREVWG
ncbi:MAG: cobalamin-independent methionine synthase II family protein [Chloroflexota bacterium]